MTAKQFRHWYESRNLTQEEVAGLLGIYRNRVSRMATGAVRVSRQTARMLLVCEPILSLSPDPAREAVCRLTKALDVAERAQRDLSFVAWPDSSSESEGACSSS